ncbi:hypothetical protein [Saccharothrix coeruleofusca]|uniref:Uncharacterized protein n=1 Tax=Saccharothrix coeruleofusca TaxID=33919 RepID=A0A918AP36_9PSEU|nr:hypothetical protein [Saccharothrix coeruleofusca]MBP2339587.1 hypothetical protein [Saccharothrix coeruleofusca]GGP56638.1 hypothetical protein GCM10010185_31090 [Saccharothrix coeruleofusca]
MTRDLLADLADLLNRVDPVPAPLADAAAAALAQRLDPAVPLPLIADSALEDPEGVRGVGGARTLRFADLDLRLEPRGRRAVHVVGRAREAADAVVRWPGGGAWAAAERGWFQFEGVPCGPVAFVLRGPGRADRGTGWFVA